MSNVTSIFKNKPDPEEYIPSGVVLMAMEWLQIGDPQEAWDELVKQVLIEAYKGDEEVNKDKATSMIREWADSMGAKA